VGWFITINQVVVVLGAILQMLAKRRERPLSGHRVAECLLSWSPPVNMGVGGIMGFMGHTMRAKETAEEIGWPAGYPFQGPASGKV
jgi:hypothetical protein